MKKKSVFFIGALLALSLVSCDVQPPVESTEAVTVDVTEFTETEAVSAEETEAVTVWETTVETAVETTAETAEDTTAEVTKDNRPPKTEEVTTVVTEPEKFSYEKSDLSEYIMLGKYLGIEVNVESLPEFSNEQIDIELELFMESIAHDAAIFDGECKLGDKVNIDYSGTIDGEEFFGSSGDGYTLTVGNHEYIVNVDDGIVGMSVGETKAIEAVFPSDYGNENYNGKTAVFEITLNFIYPELTDSLVAEYTDCETVSEFKKSIQDATLAGYREILRDTAIDKAMANSYVIGLPEDEVLAVFERTVGMNKLIAEKILVPYEEYLLEAYGISESEADEIFMSSAKNEVEQKILVYAIARDMGMDVSRSACEQYILEFSGFDGAEEFLSNTEITEEQFQNLSYTAIREKVISEIVSQAVFVKHSYK